MDWFITFFEFALAFGFGLAFGSYATMPYYRLPRGEPCAGRWIGIRSRCPSCGTQLRTRDLLPVFNWLLTLGKCQFCGVKISPMYFFVEFSVLMCSLLAWWRYGLFDPVLSQYYVLSFGLGVCLVILMATDRDTFHVIPGQVLVVIAMLGMIWRVMQDGMLHPMVQTSVIAGIIALIAGRAWERMTGKEIKNYGHFKLYALAGVWFHFWQLMFFTGFFLLFAAPLWLYNSGVSGKKQHLPLAIPLAIAYLLLVLFPDMPEWLGLPSTTTSLVSDFAKDIPAARIR